MSFWHVFTVCRDVNLFLVLFLIITLCGTWLRSLLLRVGRGPERKVGFQSSSLGYFCEIFKNTAPHLLSALTQSFLSGPTFPTSSLSLLLIWESLPSSFSQVWPSSERESQLLRFEDSRAQTGSAPSDFAMAMLLAPLEGTVALVCSCCSQLGSRSSLLECFCAISSIGQPGFSAIFLVDASITQVSELLAI